MRHLVEKCVLFIIMPTIGSCLWLHMFFCTTCVISFSSLVQHCDVPFQFAAGRRREEEAIQPPPGAASATGSQSGAGRSAWQCK